MKRTMTEAQRAALEKARKAAAAKRAVGGLHRPSPNRTEAGPPELAKLLELPAAPPKMRRSSKDPKTPPAEVPAWVKSAEAGPPLERTLETTATADDDRATTGKSSTPGQFHFPDIKVDAKKKEHGVRKSKRAKEIGFQAVPHKQVPELQAAAPPPGSLRAVGSAWLAELRRDGHSELTVKTYARNLEVAYEFFGPDVTPPTAAALNRFNESKAVTTKPNGKPRAKPTILQIRRTVRMALAWASKLAG